MNDNDWIHVESWMGRRLGLRGNLLLCFALIHGYSKTGNGLFIGGTKYICEMLYCTEPTALACLDKLVELELIRKDKECIKGHERCVYYACVSFINNELVYLEKPKKSLVGQTKSSLVGQTKKSLVGYILNNKEINNKEKRLSKDNPKKVFIKPTIEQIEAYIREKDYHFDAEQFWNHYESVGWMIGKNHMKDWHCACATWEGRRKQERKEKEEKEETEPNEIPADDIEAWENNQKWMALRTPRIAKMVTYQTFAKMRAISIWNNKLYAEVLMEIDRSGYDGDIVVEFNRLIDKHSRA